MTTETPSTADRTTAISSTVIFHALLLGIFFVSLVRLPEAPILGNNGIVLNYGQLDESGSGDVQTNAPANASLNKENSAPSQNDPTPPPPTEAVPTPVQPDADPDAKPTMTNEVEITVAAPNSDVKEVTKSAPTPTVNPNAAYTPQKMGGNSISGTSNTPTGNNNGDRPGSIGDQGNPNGDLNAQALYERAGTGRTGPGVGSLRMPGWIWDEKPLVKDASSENGLLVFDIKVNSGGELESIVKISGNVTPAVEQLYRTALEETSFKRTAGGAGGASGIVTFHIVAR